MKKFKSKDYVMNEEEVISMIEEELHIGCAQLDLSKEALNFVEWPYGKRSSGMTDMEEHFFREGIRFATYLIKTRTTRIINN